MVEMKTELAFERQRNVVLGLDLALRSFTARTMAGCCGDKGSGEYHRTTRQRTYTNERHDLEGTFNLFSGDALAVCFAQGLGTLGAK